MASEAGPTDGKPPDAQKNSLKEKLKNCPGACWKALTDCYKTPKIQPSSTPGPNYRMPSSDMDEKESVNKQENKLPDGQPPISLFQPPEEEPPQAEEPLVDPSKLTKAVRFSEEEYSSPLLGTYEQHHTVDSLLQAGVFNRAANYRDVRTEAEKWARPLRSNYELHNAFIKLEFKDFEDLSNKLKEDTQLVDKFKEIGASFSSDEATRRDEIKSLIIISNAISLFTKTALQKSHDMTKEERQQLMEYMGQVLFGVDTQDIRQEDAISVYHNEKFNLILSKAGFSQSLIRGKHQIKWTGSDTSKRRLTAAFFLIWGTCIRENEL